MTTIRILVAAFLLLSVVLTVSALKAGDKVIVMSGLNLRDNACGNVVYTTGKSVRGTVARVSSAEGCPLGKYTWVAVRLQKKKGLLWGAKETGLIIEDSGKPYVNYNVSMVYQRWDTGDEFDGRWACGPTSATMAASYFGVLPKKPYWTSKPHGHNNDYGYYVSNEYKSVVTGNVFSQTMPDPSGRPFAGAWGECTDGHLAWAWRIQSFVEKNGLKHAFFADSSYESVRSALQRGRLVVQSTRLTGGGHLVLVRGYDDASGRLIVNDPWGNQGLPGYGTKMNGENIAYTMNQMKLKWRVEVWRE